MLHFDLSKLAEKIRRTLAAYPQRLQSSVNRYIQSGRLLRDVADAARDSIIRRTARERRDIDGRPFAEYSDHYALWKERRTGYKGEPNLTLTGKMLGNITFSPDGPTRGKLTFADRSSALKARAHHLGLPPHLPRRPFFGIRPASKEASELTSRIVQLLSSQLQ